MEDNKRALVAVALSALILITWQYFFAPTPDFSDTMKNSKTTEVASNATASSKPTLKAPKTINNPEVELKVEDIQLSNKNFTYTLNSYLDVKNIQISGEELKFEPFFTSIENDIYLNIDGSFKKYNFNLNKTADDKVIVNNDFFQGTITLTEQGFLEYQIAGSKDFTYRFEMISNTENESGGLLPTMSGRTQTFSYLATDFNTVAIGSEDSGDVDLKWFALDQDYQIFATIFPDKNPHLFKVKESGHSSVYTVKPVKELSFRRIYTEKNYDRLLSLGNKLELSIDFGIWSVIAVPMLRGLQMFYDWIPNYGIAIILLTLIIRMLTFPLQFKSFKSMKKMQEIQPEMTKLREKYKENPQRLQQETMALFKRAGANPLSGCLPMLLQMPIFFAFYRMLYSSVELVNAPFVLWIKDLSVKDPYFVLPVLMGIAMFANQKLTPTTVSDPTQKKVMMFMPIIFAFIMKDFPAGLTLYIVVSTFFGIAQQLYVYKRA